MMNMKALANNFGVAEIEFRDWQEKGLVILNGVVSIETENKSYKAAGVLEITVPDMSISRSAVTAVFLRSSKSDGASTIVKSWIKDVRTICVEKLPEFDEFGPLTLYFTSAYVTLGHRTDCPLNTVLRPSIVNGGSGSQSVSDTKAIVTDCWCYLYICFNKFAGADYKDAFECTLEGLPEDIDITFPVVTASAYAYTFGTPTSICRIKGKTLSCEGRLAFGEGTNQGDFINIFIVRNEAGKTAIEGNTADADSNSNDIDQ